MRVQQLCTPDIACCGPRTTVSGAARLMRERHVGDLVVVDDPDGDHTPLGMVSDRDLVIEALARDLDPARTLVHEIMSAPVVVAGSTEDVSEAIKRMRIHGVRRVPVMSEDRKLVGIVCVDDLIKQLAQDARALIEVIDRAQSRERRTRR